MAYNYHQLSLKDTFSDCKNLFLDDIPSFFQLLEQHFDISLFIPQTFLTPFINTLDAKEIIRLPVSFLLSSYKKSSPSLQMLCLSCF